MEEARLLPAQLLQVAQVVLCHLLGAGAVPHDCREFPARHDMGRGRLPITL